MLTIDHLMARLYRNPLLQNVPLYDIVDHLKDFIRLIHLPSKTISKTITLEVKEFRAILPNDLISVKSVKLINGSGDKIRIPVSTEDSIEHLRDNNTLGNFSSTYSYKVVLPYIYFDVEEGSAEIIYTGIHVDEKGYPILPDIPSLAMAFENFVKLQYFTVLVENNQLSENSLARAEQQYNWYFGQAERELEQFTEDKAESLMNQLIRLLPDRDAFYSDFKFNSNKENLNLDA